MHIYHFEEPGLTSAEVARLTDAVGIGKLLRYQALDRLRFLIESAEGLYILTSGDPATSGTRHSLQHGEPVQMFGLTFTCLEL